MPRALSLTPVMAWLHRSDVPVETWKSLVDDAQEYFDFLAYSGLFFLELADDILTHFRNRCASGLKVRIAIGDPAAPAVAQRSLDEQLDLPPRIKITMQYCRAIMDIEGVEVRLHTTTLYNSIYRSDDRMIVNTHMYRTRAPHAPVIELHRNQTPDLFTTYEDNFATIWEEATPLPKNEAESTGGTQN